jgi:hypothetical protein
MADLLDVVASWPSLVSVLLIFGFAPRATLRLLVRAYPKGDPRRAELPAELEAVPRAERPLWVVEQIEVALFDGLPQRLHIWKTTRALRRRFIREHTTLIELAKRMADLEKTFQSAIDSGAIGRSMEATGNEPSENARSVLQQYADELKSLKRDRAATDALIAATHRDYDHLVYPFRHRVRRFLGKR